MEEIIKLLREKEEKLDDSYISIRYFSDYSGCVYNSVDRSLLVFFSEQELIEWLKN